MCQAMGPLNVSSYTYLLQRAKTNEIYSPTELLYNFKIVKNKKKAVSFLSRIQCPPLTAMEQLTASLRFALLTRHLF